MIDKPIINNQRTLEKQMNTKKDSDHENYFFDKNGKFQPRRPADQHHNQEC